VLRCKYGPRPALATVLGRLLADRLALSGWADRVDRIVAVPLHWTRRVKRGFNQARGMAGELGRAVPAAPRVDRRTLVRTRPTAHQTGIPAPRRRRNVRGAFRVRRGTDLDGETVLLVDDVMTSGSTVAECARVLKRAGAADVYIAVAATADFDDPGPW
jgi:ComF family protein